MPNTYVKLQEILVPASGSPTIDIMNIPQGFTDLVIKASLRSTASLVRVGYSATLNDDTTSSYLRREFYHEDGTGGSENAQTNRQIGGCNGANSTASTFTSCEIYIPNYSVSGVQKTLIVDSFQPHGATTGYSIWSTTLQYQRGIPVNKISLTPASGNWAQYSSVSVYGIGAKNITDTAKAFGGNVNNWLDGYTYHTFLNSSTFKPYTNLTCDILVIAGGGGGGTRGGGGGAGGFVYLGSQSLTANTTYPVTVGVGGTGSLVSSQRGFNGRNSQFGSFTAAIGGGGGGSVDSDRTGAAGGSGGGACVGNNGGAGTSGQGNNGTTGFSGGADTGGAGGGAGGSGTAGTTSVGGNGGPGISTYSAFAYATGTGVNGLYAGGGGGGVNSGATAGTGGSGGGGAGAAGAVAGSNAIPHSGSGGGGGGNIGAGGNGASGIVIVRYLS